MYITDNPYLDADRWEDEQAARYKGRPICKMCGEHISDEYGYELGGDLLCEQCKDEYLTEVRVNMETYD